jgi:hypothetical protein
MPRSGVLLTVAVLLLCSSVAQADISAVAEYIRTRGYCELSTSNPIGSIEANDIDKASGLIPSIGAGLVVWADGRNGRIATMGYDLTDPNNIANPSNGEFLISDANDGWQENNPFAGYSSVGSYRYVAYDAVDVGSSSGDLGNIQGSRVPAGSAWLVTDSNRQRSPVLTNVTSSQTVLAWIHQPGTASAFPGYQNIDIHAGTLNAAGTALSGVTDLTAGNAAPRDHLAADGRYLAWQELRYNETLDVTSWDVVVYDLGGTYPDANLRFRYDANGTAPSKNQITPDLSRNLLVWAQEEDPAGTGATNIYFQDLASIAGPLAVTTAGSAANPAISVYADDGNFAFVVWQDHRGDGNTLSSFAGGNGETDYNWDIWAQELRITAGEWALYKDAFLIPADTLGRQTNPDIDEYLNVCWQSQDPGVEDIYVWGPLAVPEPGTMLVLAAGAGLLCRGRRTSGKGR